MEQNATTAYCSHGNFVKQIRMLVQPIPVWLYQNLNQDSLRRIFKAGEITALTARTVRARKAYQPYPMHNPQENV
jgi:hypothetical protein